MTNSSDVTLGNQSGLPPGQFDYGSMPRFGLPKYTNRFPANTTDARLAISGNVTSNFELASELLAMPRTTQVSDFHCVTTWSVRNIEWQGVRFKDFYDQLIQPKLNSENPTGFAIFRAQDGYKICLSLEDLFSDDVLLATHLNGEALSIAHGAPLRLVAPKLYGYKSMKHLKSIEFISDRSAYKQGWMGFIEHPRGRVAQEERAKYVPGWLVRYPNRMMIKSTERSYAKALEDHLSKSSA